MNTARLFRPYERELITALVRLVNIPSVYDPKTIRKGQPYGEGVARALDYVAELGERFGFSVDHCDGHCVELTTGEEGPLIGIFAHVDVVPVSGTWKHEPFGGKIVRRRIYGRGTSDDKGPLLAALFAIKALKDNGLIRNCRVRLVAGGDEERGSSCLDHYFKVLKKEEPRFGFTPDAFFPLIYGEKGQTFFQAETKIDLGPIISLSGGSASNAVCDRVSVLLKKDVRFITYLEKNRIRYHCESEKETMKVIFLGKAAHGSTPEKGINAALIALKALGSFYEYPALTDLEAKLKDPSGRLFNGFRKSRRLGATTWNLGLISYSKKKLTMTFDFRFGEDVDKDSMLDNFARTFGLKITLLEQAPCLLFDPRSKLVRTLLKAYRQETDDLSRPLTSGGGTYAKHAKNTVAFGALFPHSKNVMHQADEYIHLDDLILAARIYLRAIRALGSIDADKI